jgi:hypothetical protein
MTTVFPVFPMPPTAAHISMAHVHVGVWLHRRAAVRVLAAKNDSTTADYCKRQDSEYFLQLLSLLGKFLKQLFLRPKPPQVNVL